MLCCPRRTSCCSSQPTLISAQPGWCPQDVTRILTPSPKCHLLTPTLCRAFITAQASKTTPLAQPNLSWAGDPGPRPHYLGGTSQRDTLQALQAPLPLPAPLAAPPALHRAIPREQSPEQSHLLLLGLRDTLCWERGETETWDKAQLRPRILPRERKSLPSRYQAPPQKGCTKALLSSSSWRKD